MKTIIYAVLFICFVPLFSMGETDALKVVPKIYPQEVKVGDIAFFVANITNTTENDVYYTLPRLGCTFCQKISLKQDDDILFVWETESVLDDNMRLFMSGRHYNKEQGTQKSPNKLAPKEEKTLIRPLWIPQHEFFNNQLVTKLNSNAKMKKEFVLDCDDNFYYAVEISNTGELVTGKEYPHTDLIKMQIPIIISSRPQEELELIKNWYLQMPSTFGGGSYFWSSDGCFAHSAYTEGSPLITNETNNDKLFDERKKQIPLYQKYIQQFETLTPESKARIERTNELAAEIIKRAEQPNSTISTNMKEFVQLRGFLVDMRYAENDTACDTAFDKMVKWLKTSKDKELWLQLLDNVGLGSIMHHEYFPYEKVDKYREKLRKLDL